MHSRNLSAYFFSVPECTRVYLSVPECTQEYLSVSVLSYLRYLELNPKALRLVYRYFPNLMLNETRLFLQKICNLVAFYQTRPKGLLDPKFQSTRYLFNDKSIFISKSYTILASRNSYTLRIQCQNSERFQSRKGLQRQRCQLVCSFVRPSVTLF